MLDQGGLALLLSTVLHSQPGRARGLPFGEYPWGNKASLRAAIGVGGGGRAPVRV
jgi:hypothetical protein